MHAINKGLLWQQRERLFSRWKERYFILTKDYLHCFKKSTGGLSPMGQFIYKVKLVEVDRVEWINKKSYSMIGLSLQATESRILLRAEIGLQDWFELLEECMIASKERRRALRKLHDPLWDQDSASLKFPDWVSQRGTDLADNDSFSDSVSDIQKVRSRSGRDSDFWHRPYAENRLSLLTDIDLNSCASSTPAETPPPSSFRAKPYRLNSDIFFKAPGDVIRYQKGSGAATPVYCSSVSGGGGAGGRSALTPVGSFRGPHLFNPPSNIQVKYRDRSQSDAYGSTKGRRHLESQDSRRSSHVFPIALV
ncbi:hypothetical protein AAG570_002043 [Ranatra chinensis]|uniref:PH domain-containing protein n=1 Tax=Ranatra chinensis TaxID=642074 RepID=A0ABD0YSV1_9HEMI